MIATETHPAPFRRVTKGDRLLRQSCPPQCLTVIKVGSDTRDLAVAKVEDDGLSSGDRRAAAPAARLHPDDDKQAPAEVTELLAVQVPLPPGVAQAPEVRFDTLAPTEDLAL